jgi:hypothetical protein
LDNIIFPEMDSAMQKAIHAVNLLDRTSEEMSEIQRDTQRVQRYLLERQISIEQALTKNLDNDQTEVSPGRMTLTMGHAAWLYKQKDITQQQLNDIENIFNESKNEEKIEDEEEFVYEKETHVHITSLDDLPTVNEVHDNDFCF